MKTLILATVLVLTAIGVNADTNTTSLFLEGGGSGSHGYTTNMSGNDGARPYKTLYTCSDGGAGVRGGFMLNGGSVSGGYKLSGDKQGNG